jgi:hypothetical protein
MTKQNKTKQKSQLLSEYEAKVLIKAGLQTLEQTNEGNLIITDGWLADHLIIYEKGWYANCIFKINKPILNFLNKNFRKFI